MCKLLSLTLSRDVVYSMTQLPASAHVLAWTRGGGEGGALMQNLGLTVRGG